MPKKGAITPRTIAMSEGRKTYNTGKPCVRDHTSDRSVVSMMCLACARENNAVRRALKLKIDLDRDTKYKAKHRVHLKQKQREWIARNRKYLTDEVRRWREANPDRAKTHHRKYEDANREKRNLACKCRNSIEGSYTIEEFKDLFHQQLGVCAICHMQLQNGYHADHIIPIKLGGTSWISNIQILCPPCNLSKGAKPMEQFLRYKGIS